MIERTHDLPVVQQCKILSLARSTAYYRPQETSHIDLALMRRIDELHLEHPFAGSRMLRDLLCRDGFAVGRKLVATLMKQMRIVALYKKPNTSRRHPAHLVYPYLLRHMAITRPNHVFAADITYIPMKRGFVYLFAVMDWASRRVLFVEHADDRFLPRGGTGSNSSVWGAGNLQHRPRQPIHHHGIHATTERQWRCHQHGRTWLLA